MNLPITIKINAKGNLTVNKKKLEDWHGLGILNKKGKVRVYVDAREVK